MDTLAKYKNDTIASWPRRFAALAIDVAILVVLSLAIIIGSTSILSTTENYKYHEGILKEEMINCYRLQEQAKVYEYIGEGDEKYSHPRELEDIFKDYCLSHIIYAESVDAAPFVAYNIKIENPNNIAKATYETDNLAYFYVKFAAEHNYFNQNPYDIEEVTNDYRIHFFERYKNFAVESDMWIFSLETLELPRLDSTFAADLYKYLFIDENYQTGKTCYNFLSVNFQRLWNHEIDVLIASQRYQQHYQLYKNSYAECSYMADATIAIDYVISFFLVFVLPMLIFKKYKTFGKKIMKLTVVDKQGYDLQIWQKLCRTSLIFIIMFGALVPSCFLAGGTGSGWMYPIFEIAGGGISLFSIMTILFLIGLISFIVLVFTKKRTSIHDLICSTVVIDDRYHVEIEEALEIKKEVEEKELKEEKFIEIEQPKYFDSSSFNNSERKDLSSED